MSEELTREESKALMREAVKEAANEWLSDQLRTFGKWSLTGITSAGLVALLYFILTINGWHK